MYNYESPTFYKIVYIKGLTFYYSEQRNQIIFADTFVSDYRSFDVANFKLAYPNIFAHIKKESLKSL